MGLDGGTDLEEEERLKAFLLQLRSESGILERMVYKNKNQHRRCSYFQSLLKVRRDVRLLQSVGLEDILKYASQVIHGKNPAQRVYLLERYREHVVQMQEEGSRLKERHSSGKHNFQERLLGVARLLSQMIEPILMAAIQISSLLARSFFVAFSLTILSLLARLRVLVQQMLIDIVSVFNTVSSLSQRKHTVKLIKNGVEAFREYYPPNGGVISLDCSWQGDKFVLFERTHQNTTKGLEDVGVATLEAPDIHYETLVASDEDKLGASDEGHEACAGKRHTDFDIEELASSLPARHVSAIPADTDDASFSGCKDEGKTIRGPSAEPPYGVDLHTTGVSSSSSRRPYAPNKTRKSPAFVPVKVTSEPTQTRPKKMKLDDSLGSNPLDTSEAQYSFFNLLTAGSLKSSLFD